MQRKKTQGNRGLMIAAIVGFILLVGSRQIIAFMADWRFFREVGFEAVFTKTFKAKLLLGLAFGLATFCIISLNLFIAGKRRLPLGGESGLGEHTAAAAR